MKKLLLFVFAVLAFTACTQDIVVDITPAPIVDEAPETLVVDFEGDDTRIQLQNGKTVWTKGDEVSVFYRSDANQKWQYRGETGSRTAELKRVDAGTATTPTTAVVVVYPYDANYYLNTRTFNIQATLPAVQHYLANSYGLDGNIMISSAEYNDVTLKNVCGWLKLQLTGDGEVVKSITFKGNNGEQVAGELYINSAEATAILASDMGNIAEDDGESVTGGAGANLSFDDVVLKEVTLDCGEGVTLGKSATAFYIALPPQTFTQGLTVEITDDSGYTMTQATDKEVAIERNTIQPMAAIDFVNPNTPAQPTPANNQIWYTAKTKAEPNLTDKYAFGADVISNAWDSETGKGIITFDGNVTMVGYQAFYNCDNFITINLPDSVTTIGEYAFMFCNSLTSVNIPESVTTIGEEAFANCTNLKEFTGKYAADGGRCLIIDNTIIAYANASGTTYTIPESVTTIGNGAFYYCKSLTSVNIPESVTSIGNYAFYDCIRLTSVNIPDSVKTIGYRAFCGCNSLTSVNIPESVTTIGEEAFWICTSLTSVNIPESVTTIGSHAFSSCSSLTSVTIPDSVTTIGNGAFYYCKSLKYVYCKATTPPALGWNVFDDNASGRRIIVPIGSGEAYKTAKYWSGYADSIFEDEF